MWPTSIPSATLIHPVVWPHWTRVENLAVGLRPLFGRGAESPCNIQSSGPSPTYIPSGIFAPLAEGQLGPHLTQCGQGRGLPAYQVSSLYAQPFGHNIPTSQTDRQTGQDRQRSDSIGRIVLQTVAQKRCKSLSVMSVKFVPV